ncbi:MAG: MATE family efflux transporter [Cellulosilyticaceae bacterium]
MEAIFSKKFTMWQFLKFVSPSIISMVFLSLYTIIDGIFVSNFVGSDALAAINIVLPTMSVIWGIGIMMSTGGSAIIGYKMGENKKQEANEIFSLIVVVSAAMGIVISIVSLIFIEDIMKFMGADEKLLSYCITYGSIILGITPIAIVKSLMEYLIRTDGNAKMSLIISVIGGIWNIVFDYILIVVLDMGIAGAAIATVTGILLSMLLGIAYFIWGKSVLKFTKPKWDLKVIIETMTNGCSELVTELSTGVTTFLFNMAVMKFAGADGVAALTIILYAHFLLISTYLGFIMGLSPMISYNYGGGNIKKVKETMRHSIYFLAVSAIVVFLVALFGGETIVRAFITPGTDVYNLAVQGMQIFSWGFLVMGVNVFASGLFTAFGNGKISAIISFSRAFLFIIVGLVVLVPALELNGIWMTIPFAEFMTVAISIALMKKYRKQYGY